MFVVQDYFMIRKLLCQKFTTGSQATTQVTLIQVSMDKIVATDGMPVFIAQNQLDGTSSVLSELIDARSIGTFPTLDAVPTKRLHTAIRLEADLEVIDQSETLIG